MTPKQYKPIYCWFEGHPRCKNGVIVLAKLLTLGVAILYLVLLVVWTMRIAGEWRLGHSAAALEAMRRQARAILVPAGALIFGTILRSRLNFPRPYEQPGFLPLAPKETEGQSFPSRHTLSAAVVAVAWWPVSPAVSAILLGVMVLIAVSRVILGVHYPRDVVAGAAFGIFFGAVGMFL